MCVNEEGVRDSATIGLFIKAHIPIHVVIVKLIRSTLRSTSHQQWKISGRSLKRPSTSVRGRALPPPSVPCSPPSLCPRLCCAPSCKSTSTPSLHIHPRHPRDAVCGVSGRTDWLLTMSHAVAGDFICAGGDRRERLGDSRSRYQVLQRRTCRLRISPASELLHRALSCCTRVRALAAQSSIDVCAPGAALVRCAHAQIGQIDPRGRSAAEDGSDPVKAIGRVSWRRSVAFADPMRAVGER